MAAVFAQMRRDAVGAGRNRDLGGLHRIGMLAAARIAHGSDVVDVDAEADGSLRAWDSFAAIWSNSRFSNRARVEIHARC